MEERELYQPVYDLLTLKGYLVKGEVKDLDVLAVKNDHTVAVELKTSISLKLIYQAIERQKICDQVYVAIPAEAIQSHRTNFRSFEYLLKRLELGLIIVKNNQAEVILETFGFDLEKSRRANRKNQRVVMKEFSLRENFENIGGSKGRKFTYYREKVLLIAKTLQERIISSPKELSILTNLTDTSSILQKNYYGWFERIDRGLYRLSAIGKQEIQVYLDIRV